MEEIKAPKKERKFLKAMGDVALTLFRELLLGVGKKVINKVGNKRQALAIAFVMVVGVSYAAIDSIPYPITGNKQKLGWQTTGNGLVYRGTAADTVTKPSNYTNKDIKAYLLVDTVNNVMYSYIASKGGWKFNNSDTVIINNNFAQPVDSLFFKTSVATNNVDTAKMRWDSDLATVVLGMYDQVPNELGFKNFWLVKNQTGSTITKGSIVYANGTVGASGRITVAKFIANGSIDAKYLLGITAHDLTNGEDGYVISFGKIRKVNTDTFVAGSILYPSPTVAGVWTDVEPVAPNIDMPIGFCINSHVNNGTIAIRVASGYKLHELHDLAISSPIDKASLYYKSSEGLWRDTTATLLVSDTAAMLTPYFMDADTTSLNLTSRFAAKLNISDTAAMLTNYLRTGVAASTYQPILVSGTNIKTVNSNSLLGSGNISVGTVTSVGGTGTVNGITLTGTVTSSGNLTLGGTLSGVSLSSQVSGTLPIANGGTNAATISQARTNLQVPNIATTITPQAPLTGGGSLAGDRTISIPVATSVANGYLSSTDWSTFNGKQNAITLTTTGTSGAATLTGATLNIPQYSGGGSGTVTSVTTTSPLSVINSTTTPQISISAASGTSSAGVVTTTTQQFGGAKTFNDNLTTNGNMEVDGTMNVDLKATFGAAIKATSLERNVVNTTGTSITLGIATTWLNIHQSSNFTVTLPSAATYPGKEIHIRNSAGGVVLSASSNIIDMAVSHAGSTTTIIMAGGTAGQFTTLVSDGTNWIQTQLDNN
jgi:hypothetical protein